MTPGKGQTPGPTPLRTPIKDKLSINPEDEYEDADYAKFQQVTVYIKTLHLKL